LTWGQPTNKLELTDPDLGQVQVLVGRQLHFRKVAQQAFLVVRIEHLDAAHSAHDPGVEALIEVKIPLMALHLARSDGGEGSRKEGDDQMVFPIVLTQVADESIMGG
jgi:hypothetical protein